MALCPRQAVSVPARSRTIFRPAASAQQLCSRRLCSPSSATAPSPSTFSSLFCRSLPTTLPSVARRDYHSFDHSNELPIQDRFSSAEQAILSAASHHIPEHGFTERTIALGARDAGYPAISSAILPDGVFSLVRWHLVTQRTSLAARSREIFGAAEDVELSPADVAKRTERLTWERLLANADVVGRWQEVNINWPHSFRCPLCWKC